MKSFGDILWCEERRESTYWSNPQSTPAEANELLEEPRECREHRRETKYHRTEVKGRMWKHFRGLCLLLDYKVLDISWFYFCFLPVCSIPIFNQYKVLHVMDTSVNN